MQKESRHCDFYKELLVQGLNQATQRYFLSIMSTILYAEVTICEISRLRKDILCRNGNPMLHQ